MPGLAFKREDLNPTGSHKDRAASFQVAAAVERGDRAVVISSSGNAAIATSRFAEQYGIPAVVTVHPATDPAKLRAICGATTTVVVTERAINAARKIARALGTENLRPSTHPEALEGYAPLAAELVEGDSDHLPDAIVVFATSGTTALAIGRAALKRGVQLHVVQGEGNAGIVNSAATPSSATSQQAAAGRLGVRASARAEELRSLVAATGGRGHVADAHDVQVGRDLLIAEGIEVGEESAANAWAAMRLVEEGMRVIAIASGAPPAPWGTPLRVLSAIDEHDALRQVREAFHD